MTKAFVDTTVLTDSLLKPKTKGIAAKAALKRFDETLLPVYAIKEFKAGPMYYYVWTHNKFALASSFQDALEALHGMILSPRKYLPATAVEAIQTAVAENLSLSFKSLANKYGEKATANVALRDLFRASLKVLILKAWKQRRTVTTEVVQPLTCYPEVGPTASDLLIEMDTGKCKPEKECCLGPSLRKRTDDLKTLVETIKNLTEKPENDKRHKVLREISRKPTDAISETYCRGLGDAYFALFCPKDAVILSTNISDHEPLARALGKKAQDV